MVSIYKDFLKKGDIVLVRMRVVDTKGDEGGLYVVPDFWDKEIYLEEQIKELIYPDDIVGKLVNGYWFLPK